MSRDQKFFDMYSLVIGILAAFALAILVLAMKMSDLTQGMNTGVRSTGSRHTDRMVGNG